MNYFLNATIRVQTLLNLKNDYQKYGGFEYNRNEKFVCSIIKIELMFDFMIHFLFLG